MGRPRLFDESASLDAAVQEFWVKGYRSASVDELLRAMGMSRASMYRTFGCKKALFERVLTLYRERHIDPSIRLLTSGRGWPAVVEWLIGAWQRSQPDENGAHDAPPGCLLDKVRHELEACEPELATLVEDCMTDLGAAVRAALTRAVDLGQIPSTLDLETLSRFVLVIYSGLARPMTAGFTEESLRKCLERLIAQDRQW